MWLRSGAESIIWTLPTDFNFLAYVLIRFQKVHILKIFSKPLHSKKHSKVSRLKQITKIGIKTDYLHRSNSIADIL